MEEEYLPEYGPKWSDQNAERLLGALVCAVVGLLLAMIITVFARAWPSFAHNGLAWFGAGGSVEEQLNQIYLSGSCPAPPRWSPPCSACLSSSPSSATTW